MGALVITGPDRLSGEASFKIRENSGKRSQAKVLILLPTCPEAIAWLACCCTACC